MTDVDALKALLSEILEKEIFIVRTEAKVAEAKGIAKGMRDRYRRELARIAEKGDG